MSEVDYLYLIYNSLQIISLFLQLLFYGCFVFLIIHFGYWFFSRFFY